MIFIRCYETIWFNVNAIFQVFNGHLFTCSADKTTRSFSIQVSAPCKPNPGSFCVEHCLFLYPIKHRGVWRLIQNGQPWLFTIYLDKPVGSWKHKTRSRLKKLPGFVNGKQPLARRKFLRPEERLPWKSFLGAAACARKTPRGRRWSGVWMFAFWLCALEGCMPGRL